MLSPVTNLVFLSTIQKQKKHSLEWHTENLPRPKKARMTKLKIKFMLICLMDSAEIIYKEFVPSEQTVNQHFYHEVLERLRKRVARVRPDIKEKLVLHHDNAPCHAALSITEFFVKEVHSCSLTASILTES